MPGETIGRLLDTETASVLCQLIRLAKNTEYKIDEDLIKVVDWEKVMNLAFSQGVLAISLDAISLLPESLRPKSITLLEWIGEVLNLETNYERHANVISELSSFYEEHGIKMMLLKGWGLSLNYPVPNHRPTGDIDIWLYGNQKKGDKLIESEKGIHPIKSSHHTIFFYDEVEVENHITFIEVDCHKTDGSEEILLDYAKEPAIEAVCSKENTILLPSPNLNAFFLLRHSAAHFATERITIRHLLDWAFFVQKYYDRIDWDALYANAKDKNLHVFLDCQNAICVNELGFDKDYFPIHEKYSELEKRIFNDILFPEFREEAPGIRENFIKYCFVKTKRQFANKWKYSITYNESFWSILMRFAWNRIKSPYSFGDIVEKNKQK